MKKLTIRNQQQLLKTKMALTIRTIWQKNAKFLIKIAANMLKRTSMCNKSNWFS